MIRTETPKSETDPEVAQTGSNKKMRDKKGEKEREKEREKEKEKEKMLKDVSCFILVAKLHIFCCIDLMHNLWSGIICA